MYFACEIVMFPQLFSLSPDDKFCDYMFSSDFVIMLYICIDGSTKLESKIVYSQGFI